MTHQRRLATSPRSRSYKSRNRELDPTAQRRAGEVEQLSHRLDKKEVQQEAERTLEEEQPAACSLGCFPGSSTRRGGSGAVVASRTGPVEVIRSAAESREPRTLPAQSVRALPAPRRSLPPKSETTEGCRRHTIQPGTDRQCSPRPGLLVLPRPLPHAVSRNISAIDAHPHYPSTYWPTPQSLLRGDAPAEKYIREVGMPNR